MDESLINAAKAGDRSHLYELLRQNAFILEVFDQIPFVDTPLHVAILAGQTHFVVEVINLKPSFTKKLNQDGFSPLHLAVANGHFEIVRELLRIDQNLCFLRGRDDKIPLHCAIENGKMDVLDLLISTCPNSVTELSIGGETILHRAMKNGRVETFKALVERLPTLKMTNILGWKDQEGNTILHVAISLRQLEMMEFLLLGPCRKSVRKVANVTNVRGLTAFDIFRELDTSHEVERNDRLRLRKIGDILSSASGPKRCRCILASACFCCCGGCNLMRCVTKKFKVNKGTPTTSSSGGATATDNISAFIELVKAANYAAFTLSFILIYNLTNGFPLRIPVRMALIFMLWVISKVESRTRI
ncbi:ankyrin repeat-containing protein BDA1-like [Macadamia integrifolia]|uniref:ankyrin repeat-containing protein BDA1-like n=1 Tax=Macadamia integrifolia TaxID=60698 RepID=UPI001C4FB262|nr:ankyrin repeat-containing protein BDA1-like [Macadamia integrifolia]